MALMRASTCHWLIMMAIIVMTVMVIMVMMVMMVKFFKDWKPHFLDKTGAYHTTVTMEVDNEWYYKVECQSKSSETFFILKWLSSVNVQARLTPTGWVMLQARQPKQLILSSTCTTNHQSENSIAHTWRTYILQPKQTWAEVSAAQNVLNKLLIQAIDGAFFNP